MKKLIVICSIPLVVACNSSQHETQIANNSDTSVSAPDTALYKDVEIYSLPAPLQIPAELKKHSPQFHEDLLKPIHTTDQGTTNFKKVLYLGVYSVDLGYAAIYNQTQIAINYLAASVRLSQDLHIPSMDQNLIERYKNNISNSDSTNKLIISSFSAINRSLTESNRFTDESLILTGSFIEGVYLSTSIYKKDKAEEIKTLIGNQKFFLDNLIEILSGYSNEESADLLKSLHKLKDEFDGIKVEYHGNESDSIREISNISITDKQIEKISDLVKKVRTDIIS
jgi:hypothetical protein